MAGTPKSCVPPARLGFVAPRNTTTPGLRILHQKSEDDEELPVGCIAVGGESAAGEATEDASAGTAEVIAFGLSNIT